MRKAALVAGMFPAWFLVVACGDDDAPAKQASDAGIDASPDAGSDAADTGADVSPDAPHADAADAADASETSDAPLDSDGDCIPDALESSGDSDGDGKPNVLDADSDGDGLADGKEDANCNGQIDGSETSATAADSDGDGSSDLEEVAVGTDAKDPLSNPMADGDLVIVLPFGGSKPGDVLVQTKPTLDSVDFYLLVDRSASMASTVSALKANLSGIISGAACPPLGSGSPPGCFADVAVGLGSIGYVAAGGAAYQNLVDLGPNVSSVAAAFPSTESGGCCDEGTLFALWSSITGKGSAASGCALADAIPDRGACPAGPSGVGAGYPCFRPTALPFLVVVSDEAPVTGSGTLHCPSDTAVTQAALGLGARVMGLRAGADTTVDADLAALATATRAVDTGNGNAPLVASGSGAGVVNALGALLQTAKAVPLNLNATLVDDPSDGVDATKAFTWRVETAPLGSAACSSAFSQKDSDQDGHPDTYLDAPSGTPLCWKLVVEANTAVGATTAVQAFRTNVVVRAEGRVTAAQRHVYFVVPPLL